MRLLLDTHAFLWFILDDPQLSASARTLIELVAQATVEGIPIVSADVALDPYGVTRLW